MFLFDWAVITDADTAFDRALEADSNFAEAWLGRGTLLVSLGRHVDALAAIDRALALNPALPNAWVARGQVSYLEKRYDEALADWKKALELRPDQPGVDAAHLRVRMHNCDWIDFDTACAIGKIVGQQRKVDRAIRARRHTVRGVRAAAMREAVDRKQSPLRSRTALAGRTI